MNVREWKKSKLIDLGWQYSYDENLGCNAFKLNHIIVSEEQAFKVSLSLLNSIKLHDDGIMSDFILLQKFKNEEELNTVSSSELKSLIDSINWRNKRKNN